MEKVNFAKLEIILKNLIKLQYVNIKNNRFTPIPFIQGSPGIGKSEWMKNFITNLKYENDEELKDYNFAIEVKYLSTFPLEKLTGLPTPEYKNHNGHHFTKWTCPDLFKFENLVNYKEDRKNIIVLFLDDVHLVPKTMAPYLFEFYSYRTLHGYKLPDNVIIITAGNGPDDNAGYQPIPAPIISRYKFIYLENDMQYWMKNYAYKNVIPEICIFLEMNPDHFSMKPMKQNAYSCPRSWSALSDMLKNHKEIVGKLENIKDYSLGTVSEESAYELDNFVNNILKWNGKEYLEGKKFPEFGDMKRLDIASCITAIQQELLKSIRDKKNKLDDETIKVYIQNFVKIMDSLIDHLLPIAIIIIHTILTDSTIPSNITSDLIDIVLENDKIRDEIAEILE